MLGDYAPVLLPREGLGRTDMKWRPVSKMVVEATRPPYLLKSQNREEVERGLRRRGFQIGHVAAGDLHSERDASVAVARALDYPEFFGGSWDAFFDLLATEFQDRPRLLAVSMLGADALAQRDLRLFVAVSWNLFNATETVGSEGKGDCNLSSFTGATGARRPDA